MSGEFISVHRQEEVETRFGIRIEELKGRNNYVSDYQIEKYSSREGYLRLGKTGKQARRKEQTGEFVEYVSLSHQQNLVARRAAIYRQNYSGRQEILATKIDYIIPGNVRLAYELLHPDQMNLTVADVQKPDVQPFYLMNVLYSAGGKLLSFKLCDADREGLQEYYAKNPDLPVYVKTRGYSIPSVSGYRKFPGVEILTSIEQSGAYRIEDRLSSGGFAGTIRDGDWLDLEIYRIPYAYKVQNSRGRMSVEQINLDTGSFWHASAPERINTGDLYRKALSDGMDWIAIFGDVPVDLEML